MIPTKYQTHYDWNTKYQVGIGLVSVYQKVGIRLTSLLQTFICFSYLSTVCLIGLVSVSNINNSMFCKCVAILNKRRVLKVSIALHGMWASTTGLCDGKCVAIAGIVVKCVMNIIVLFATANTSVYHIFIQIVQFVQRAWVYCSAKYLLLYSTEMGRDTDA